MTSDLKAALKTLALANPAGTPINLTLIREDLLELVAGNGNGTAPAAPAAGTTWRERLWTCPADTRLGVREVAEALGRPKSWVYRSASIKRGAHRLPAARLNGELVFEAGAVRAWLQREEAPA